MAQLAPTSTQSNGQRHKRTTSAVLKSIVATRSGPRKTPNSKSTSPSKVENEKPLPPLYANSSTDPLSNPSHVSRPLGELTRNKDRARSSTRQPVAVYDEEYLGLSETRARPKRNVSLRTFGGKEKNGSSETKTSPTDKGDKPKKSKSSTSLSALLSRSKSSKSLQKEAKEAEAAQKDKENQTPPGSAWESTPPIWAQFATQQVEVTSTKKIPLNDGWDVKDELDMYTSQDYPPSKGSNFYDYRPSLSRKVDPGARPKSGLLASSSSTSSLVESFSILRKTSILTRCNGHQNQVEVKKKEPSFDDSHLNRIASQPSTADGRKFSDDSSNAALTMSKRGSRVQAAVAAFNGKDKESSSNTNEPKFDPALFDADFENMLESRNIVQEVREKMRALNMNMKADLIKQNKQSPGSNADIQAVQRMEALRPGSSMIRSTTADGISNSNSPTENDSGSAVKKSRPRSLTFTMGKGDQSLKKKKSDYAIAHARNKSADMAPSSSSRSLSSTAVAHASSFLNRSLRSATPEDFISYLKKVQRPQLVEVGRLQKLRQLLRNETVTWVDSFITKGGMVGMVELLYRIIDIEWREEHEDNLLHHTLTCLKALSTTSLGLTHLSSIQPKLFPILLQLLFSSGDEKKGPSEFSTRSIIITLLNTYLSAAPTSSLPSRAQTLLSYLRDPAPKEDERPPGFIAEMHRPRPYKKWTTEVSNVTKEVFWIFLHHVNVIPFPPPQPTDMDYTSAYFPAARPPVPAAPYVGGVEWEATTYLATHLDLLNSIIASLPTREERNTLRRQLRDSGFERTMGVSLRTCKEKFYGGVHAGLGTWIAAGREDGWDVKSVREGPPREESRSRQQSRSPKKKADMPPVLEMPKLDLGARNETHGDGGWL